MKKNIIAFAATWLCIIMSFAQADKKIIEGTVTTQTGKPAIAASVLLRNVADTAVYKTTLTDTAGRYIFTSITEGKYRITISMTGYKNNNSEGFIFTGLPLVVKNIMLEQQEKVLQEVVVQSKKQLVETKIDRTVVNVDALLSAAGSTALDVLEKSPGVIIDQSGSISLKGKQGTIVYIDDKPANLAGTELQNYLASLPSSALDQIELMPNPPAKYDAAGSGGIINIKTKKNKAKGFNGNLTLGYNQGRYTRSNNSFNINYRKNKFNFFATMSYGFINMANDLNIYRRYKNADESTRSFFLQNTFMRRKGNGYNLKLGADIYQNDKTTFGIVLTGQERPVNETNYNVANLLNAASQPDSMINAVNTEKNSFKNGSLNLNYRHKLDKKGSELTADLDYLAYKTGNDQLFLNSVYLPNGNLQTQDQLAGELPATIHIFSAKTDYTTNLAHDYKFAAGLKSSYTKTDNLAVYNYTFNNVTTPDYDKSNHFIYKENINAAYANLNKDFNKLSVQAGLRLENTVSIGNQLGNAVKADSNFRRTYTNLFPTLYLTYKLDSAGNNQLGLNYGYRIERPYYQDLNPFISPLDKFTFYVGNPFLNPSFTNSIELSHTYKNKITTTVSYSKVRSAVNETIEIVDGIYYSRPGNLGNTVIKSISIDASLEPAKWLTLHLYSELTNIHTKTNFYTGLLNTKGSFWLINPNMQFTFSKQWSGELSGRYRTAVTDAQFTSLAYGTANFTVQDKLSKSITLRAGMNDIFKSRRNDGIIHNLALTDASWNSVQDSRYFIFTLSYRFGKTIANLRRHEANGAETEQNRVKD